MPKNTVLVSMDVTSLYTNIPHEEGVTTVCHAYEDFYGDKAPIPTKYLREMTEQVLIFQGPLGKIMLIRFLISESLS